MYLIFFLKQPQLNLLTVLISNITLHSNNMPRIINQRISTDSSAQGRVTYLQFLNF